MKTKRFSLLTALILGGSVLFAQSSDNKTAYLVNVGFFDYSGDYDSYSFARGISGSLGFSRYLNPSFDILAGLSLGTVNADTKKNPGMPAGLNFKSGMGDLSMMGKYKLDNGYLLKEDSKVSPYILFGLGGFMANSSGVGFDGSFTEKVITLNLCAGVGIEFEIIPQWGIFLQTLPFFPITDKIDGWYKRPPVIPNNKVNDYFVKNSFGIIFTPGAKEQ